MMKGAALANAGPKEDRPESDFFPTPPDVTTALIDWLGLPGDTHVWEPACGDGAMADVIRGYGHFVSVSDIRPAAMPGAVTWDFLQAAWPTATAGRKPEWIITNPPFNMAEAFIRQALSITPNVAMLLKSQFWHAQSRAKLFGEHPPSAILPLTWRPDFLAGEKGGAPTMDCLWTVWWPERHFRAINPTHYQPLMRPSGTRSLL